MRRSPTMRGICKVSLLRSAPLNRVKGKGSAGAGRFHRQDAVHRCGRNLRRWLLHHNELLPAHVVPDFEDPFAKARLQQEGSKLFTALITVEAFHEPFRPDLPVLWSNGWDEVLLHVLQTGQGSTAVQDGNVDAFATAKTGPHHGNKCGHDAVRGGS